MEVLNYLSQSGGVDNIHGCGGFGFFAWVQSRPTFMLVLLLKLYCHKGFPLAGSSEMINGLLVTERDNLFPCFLLVLNKALLANKWVWRFLWIEIDYGGRSWWGSLVRNKKLGVLRWQKGG
ncbi:hypothetical protein CK203_076897 [Vitis vinifera]|uniref:Uncharacterized protein n=1 Tax=Vitis vinifera TaxID=29760 RepID=A0A438EST1_VITVI|nr:hypothetical protein CK203_076897 [Vitis vinifera]